MKMAKHAKNCISFFNMIKRGKHASNRVVFFGTSKRGKHAKDEIIVYNPLYAKITTCLGSFALATSLFTIATLGKYKGTLASSDTARVARYLIELTKKEETIIEILPKTTTNIEFEVKNYEGEKNNPDKQNEVKSKYKLKIQMMDVLDMSMEYHLYRIFSQDDQREVALTNGESDYVQVDTVSSEHKYKLQLIWQNGYDEIIYQNLSDHIRITVDSEQVD